jgi:hypothetical protein
MRSTILAMCPQRFSSFGLGRASPGTLRVGVRSPSRSLIAPATLSPWQVDGERKAVELRCDAEVLGASLFAGIVTNYDLQARRPWLPCRLFRRREGHRLTRNVGGRDCSTRGSGHPSRGLAGYRARVCHYFTGMRTRYQGHAKHRTARRTAQCPSTSGGTFPLLFRAPSLPVRTLFRH